LQHGRFALSVSFRAGFGFLGRGHFSLHSLTIGVGTLTRFFFLSFPGTASGFVSGALLGSDAFVFLALYSNVAGIFGGLHRVA
jgi:hypothetical protein